MEVFSVSGLESSLGCEFRTVICDSQLPLPNHTAHAMSDILPLANVLAFGLLKEDCSEQLY